ncbi:MAG: transcription elongation factor subunit Spt4 [Nitrososphaerales archaeon]|mgnify:FL=1|jgi:DNA-directed RNA polymerase subunit E"|nr:transcription elongation factor subunit Spt4 [Nitrososphaerales archaeon]
MVREYACRKCKSLASGKLCPACNSTDLSKDWAGLIIILDPEKSEVAKSLGISKSGRYALRVS